MNNNDFESKITRRRLSDMFTFVLGAVIFFVVLNFAKDILDFRQLPREVDLPPVEIPIEKPEIAYKSVEALKAPFLVSRDPFSEAQYGVAPRIVLGGRFKSATLFIKGEVTIDDSVFVLLNLNKDTGVVKGIRAKNGTLDVKGTLDLGGLFTMDAPINASVNLMGDSFGASTSDIEKFPSGTKTMTLIRADQLPEVYKILALPFLRNGTYGGARIDALTIQYECEDGSECSIDVCEKPKSTECITDKFGAAAATAWRTRNGI